MAERKYFFQDFLFENLPVDEQDFPEVEMKIISREEAWSVGAETISFDYLLRCNKKKEWDDIFNSVSKKDVVLIDDVIIENDEVLPYKDFYLKTYFYNLEQHCKNCYLVQPLK